MADVATRFAEDLFKSAAVEGARQSRSAKQQLDHWARVGRAFSIQQSVARRKVEAAMAGELPINALSDEESAVFNAEIAAAIEETVATLNIGEELAAQGITYVALDETGALVEYDPDGSSTVLVPADGSSH